MSEKVIALGSDHGGFHLKSEISKYLESLGYTVKDYGTYSEESVDYPEYAYKVAVAISKGEVERGVILCGTGIGISITANRFPGVRAALCWDSFTAKMSRLHNNANLLALGGRIIGVELAKDILNTWLNTEFEGGRHLRRINKIDELAAKFWKEYLEGNK
ncbi:ribose 5-phosphate isomerase B [Deferribacter autotrophicus]|uniref:Ribose 5-phosphate isomerase B n=1 Tax=Deferribacter autotrophicus TaxID=500465 RepID=A0A5A8F3E3_9BACT|nr:ribose 5-phosphate isomerase B [Deferribacter autotrophicus]KAA0257004.1 ribose 5-phosphate isomerase B [Deferribacter autotrophicus]